VGIRETIQKSQKWTVVVAAVVLVGAVIAIIVQAQSLGPAGPGDAFYTVDDGKTFFAGDSRKLAPFDYGGKQAVRAHVFECEGKKVVGYMSRYTPESLELFEEAKAARAEGRPPKNVQKLATVAFTGTELKKPGADKWVIQNDKNAPRIRIFKCKDGRTPPELYPE
jgi:hypothetical protein